MLLWKPAFIPWEKSLCCAHCSPAMFRTLEFIATNKWLAPNIWKPTRLRANKLLDQVQKCQHERNKNICSSAKCKLDFKVSWAEAPRAPSPGSSSTSCSQNDSHRAEPGVNNSFSHLIPYMFLAQCVRGHSSTTDHETPAKKQKINARKQNILWNTDFLFPKQEFPDWRVYILYQTTTFRCFPPEI